VRGWGGSSSCQILISRPFPARVPPEASRRPSGLQHTAGERGEPVCPAEACAGVPPTPRPRRARPDRYKPPGQLAAVRAPSHRFALQNHRGRPPARWRRTVYRSASHIVRAPLAWNAGQLVPVGAPSAAVRTLASGLCSIAKQAPARHVPRPRPTGGITGCQAAPVGAPTSRATPPPGGPVNGPRRLVRGDVPEEKPAPRHRLKASQRPSGLKGGRLKTWPAVALAASATTRARGGGPRGRLSGSDQFAEARRRPSALQLSA